jgi:hypothetical protein
MTIPSFSSESSPSVDALRAGEFPARTEDVTLISGQNLAAGAVLGQITLGAASSAAKAGGNTGNGTFVLDVTTPVRVGAKPGVYALRVLVVHAVHDYSVQLEDPDGNSLGTQRLTGAGASITIDDDIKGVLTDGSTDFIVGDGFDVTIAAGSGKWTLAVAAAVDGSAKAKRILAKAVDASGGDKKAPVYCTGEFAKNKLSFGAGHSATTVEADLRAENIYLNDTLAA